MLLILGFMVAMLLSVVMIPGLIRYAGHLGLVDEPNDRKVHHVTVPRIGGIAIAVGTVIPAMFWIDLDQEITAYLAASLIIVLFGIWDDRVELGYRTKFLGQTLAVSVFVYWGGVYIQWLPFQGISTVPLWLSIFLTFVSLLGITNAVNLTDGLDGLAGGTSLLSLAGIAILSLAAGATNLAMLCLIICGSIFGFLRYNTHPARIFMGDTGSQFLGFSVGVMAVLLTQKANTALSPVLPLILLGLPILDTLTVMIKRAASGRSPFSPDKNHFHHRLMDMNFKHYEAVILIYLVQVILIALAFSLRYQADAVLLVIFLIFCAGFNACFLWAESTAWKYSGKGFRTLAAPINGVLEKRRSARAVIDLIPPFLQLTLPAYLTICFVLGESDSLSSVLFVLVGAGLLVLFTSGFDWQLWLRRCTWYAACGLAIYCAEVSGFSGSPWSRAYIAVLLCLVIVSFYFGNSDDFKINPLDVIVLLGVGLVFLMKHVGVVLPSIGYHVGHIILLLYAVELALERSAVKGLDRWPLFLGLGFSLVFSLL